jgi:PAS domain S-box-containing protein
MGSWEYDLGDLNDFNANALRWSDEMYAIFGRDRSAGISNAEFLRQVPADDHAMIHDAMRRSVTEGSAYDVEHRAIKPDGGEIIVHDIGELVRDPATGKPLKLVGTVQDVTAVKRTEEVLRQAQKMEAVGQLTGGIAHDFNNLLMVVGGNLEMLAEGLAPDQQRLHRFATAALEAVMRGGQLTQRLLAFARRQKLRSEPTDLNRLIGNLVPLLHRTLGEQVTVETALASEVWLSITDGSQVENAVLNLAVNARDAMPDGGRLIIRTENLHVDRVQAADSGGLPPGDYVRISVSDNGQGMPAEIRQRVFEPFFTTKEVGRGTGLGLSMVYGFVKQSGGHVAIESEVGRGTAVHILLPRVSAVAQAVEQGSPSSLPRGHERVLVVEDEDLVRSTVRTMLESLGYDISEAAEGRQALAMYSAGPVYDLVLTDMVMPGGISGWDLAQAIWRDRPQQRFLFSTGYSDNPIIRQANLDERVQVLPKPYSKRVLATAMRAAIDRPMR